MENCDIVGLTSTDRNASGVWLASNGTLRNCRLRQCYGSDGTYGMALFIEGGWAYGCLVACNTNKNSSMSAVDLRNNESTLESCTIVGNQVNGSSTRAAVITTGVKPKIRNCIIHDNRNTGGVANWSGTASCFTYCCTTPLPQEDTGNVLPVEPMFADADWRIATGLCTDAGANQAWMETAFDLDGNPRIANEVVDLGCYEYVPGALECGVVPSAAVLVGDDEVTLAATVSGTETSGLTYSWLVVDQNGRVATNVADGAEAAISLSPGYGVYDVALTVRNAGGTEAAFSAARLFQIKAATVYVATDATPAFPYDTHATAFTNVVDAIDFAEDGMRVVITDGIYTNASNPTVAKNFTIESENGPAATTVYSVNATNPGWTLNAQGAVVRGLTLLSDNAGGQNQNRPSSIVVSAGTIDGCVATNWYSYYTPLLRVGTQGVVTNCAIVGCRTRYRCHFASVSGNGLLTGCRLVRNISDTASSAYGAIVIVNDDGSTLRNCLIADNTIASKPEHASVVYQAKGVVESCTLAGNAATGLATIPAVSIAAGTFRNNVVWGNSNTAGENGVSAVSAALVAYSCAPGLSGTGCIGDKDPRFKKASAGDYRLRSNSPCVDAGQNQAWMADAADLDGNARVNERRPAKMVDMGCYEYSRPAGSLLMSH